ncbi:MAG: hypothetical protein Hyperionvirus16_3 [Hyperionvirus sp.]|uniref:Uncharacterized protein n=1 Tax=Hyperionvirus sp. TaxID=2487770 RepID=A0A3G5A9V3_9VIRU|nr:MAG: hypothetical protein Hyperionvirus16_3 [Hyperionvirus sp.]
MSGRKGPGKTSTDTIIRRIVGVVAIGFGIFFIYLSVPRQRHICSEHYDPMNIKN